MGAEVKVLDLKRLLDAFNRHDLDAIMEFFTDDAVFDMPHGPNYYGRRFIGKPAVREGLATRFAGLPDVHYGEDSHWVARDHGCSESTLTGTRPSGEKSQSSRLRPIPIQRQQDLKERLVLENHSALN